VATALARRLASRRLDVIVAPPVGYGSSGEHAGFAGTISIGQAALELMLLELGRSAAETFRHILFISAHGGNDEPVTRAVTQLQAESRHVMAWMPGRLRDPTSAGIRGDAHAGRMETSIQLALDPARVRLSLAERGNCTSIVELMPALRSAGVRAVSRSGVLGDPVGASAGEGVELLSRLEADLLAAVSVWLRREPF
jgi:creatinine amidohydrolase